MQMGKTSITVSDETLQRFNDRKRQAGDGSVPEPSGDDFVNGLLDTWDAVDAGYYESTPEPIDVDALAEQLAGQSVTFDDVKGACEAALQETLPEEVLQG